MSIEIVDLIGNRWWNGDLREPNGACRWCDADNRDGHGLMLIRQDGQEWLECAFCARAIGDYKLFDYDADEIRRRAALIRAEEG